VNIDELTFGQLKQIAAMFPQTYAGLRPAHPLVGTYVIARCYAAGVHAGTVKAVDGENVVLTDSVRLWSWKAKDGVALSGVAQHGIDRSKCKIDTMNPIIYLTGVCELIPCANIAAESIRG
jgi:hypothetical protein